MSDNFICELPLKFYPEIMKSLYTRFRMGGFLYNAVLGEGFKRIQLMKDSKDWQKACKMPLSKEKNKLFQNLKKKFKFSDYDFQKFAIQVKNSCFIKDHLDTHTTQKIATRCFNALYQYCRNKRGKPRFKKIDTFSSVEGKSNKSGIRFKNNLIEWKGLKLTPIFQNDALERHALNCHIKYCRIIKRKIKGKDRFFAQLILNGKPFEKRSFPKDVVGLDIGPSSIAVVGKEAFLKPFCEELEEDHKKIRILKRKLERSRRSVNPENYENGSIKKGVRWKNSKSYEKTKRELSIINSSLKGQRKRAHGKLANEILTLGCNIKCEKLSYRGFQKLFGKSIGFRAPSMFLDILKHKAENAGGKVEEFSTRDTALSQICHNCEKKIKKELSNRWHKCLCGLEPVQRDLYSAFLACYVENNKLDIRKAKEAFPGVYPLLEHAMLRLSQTATSKHRLASFGLCQRQSGSHVKDRSGLDEAKDDVGVKSESFRESSSIAIR